MSKGTTTTTPTTALTSQCLEDIKGRDCLLQKKKTNENEKRIRKYTHTHIVMTLDINGDNNSF